MNNLKITDEKVTAFVVEDKTSGIVTIFSDVNGGPIVSSSSEEDAHKLFEQALYTSCSVQNLLTFKGALFGNATEIESYSRIMKNPKREVAIDYVKVFA